MNYDQRAYFLAAHADEIYLHPMGAVLIEGYGRRRNYYRDALDRLGVAVNVVRAGRYKNALETFVANGPSPETQEADTALYQGLWDQYVEAVEKARRLPSGHLRALIEGLPAESIVLSAQVVNEFYFTVTRKLRRPLAATQPADLAPDGAGRRPRPVCLDAADAHSGADRCCVDRLLPAPAGRASGSVRRGLSGLSQSPAPARERGHGGRVEGRPHQLCAGEAMQLFQRHVGLHLAHEEHQVRAVGPDDAAHLGLEVEGLEAR